MRKTTAPEPQVAPKDFMEANRPKHGPMEAMRDLIAAPPEEAAKSFLEYVGTFAATADTRKARITNLLDVYMQDIRQIYVDSQQRKDHYTAEQHELIQKMLLNMPGVTDEEKNELLLTFMRRTVTKDERDERARELERRRKKEQEENEEISLEDGRSLADAIEDEKSMGIFEKQNFGDRIII